MEDVPLLFSERMINISTRIQGNYFISQTIVVR
jgi:hypothetical protein